MDPRHPEKVLPRMKELIKQFERVEKDISECTVSNRLAQLEREGGLVVQEICLVAPRLHEGLMQDSRQRRHDLTHGVVIDMSKYKVPAGATGEEEGVMEKPVEMPHDGYLSVDKAIEKKDVSKNEEKADIEEPDVNEKPEPKPGMMDDATADKILDAVEKVAPAPKKKATKKKTTKKAKK